MTVKFRLCMKAISTLDDNDVADLADAIETYRKEGMDGPQSELFAVNDLIEGVRAERKALVAAVEGTAEYRARTQPRDDVGKFTPPAAVKLEDFTKDGIKEAIGKPGWAVLTAENPGNATLTDKRNAELTEKLRDVLVSQKIEHIEVRGKYSETARAEERSFIILADKRKAMQIGQQFGQESILTSEGLVYESGKIDKATGEVTVFDKVPDNYYTRIPGEDWAFSVGIKFDAAPTLEAMDAEEEADPDGIGKQSILSAAKQIQESLGYKNIRKQTPEGLRLTVDRLKADIKVELARDRNAAEWYRDNLNSALDRVAAVYPEVGSNPDARMTFIVALAVTSNGLTISENVFSAMELYSEYRDSKDGKLPERGFGVRHNNMAGAISKFNELVELVGPSDAMEFLATPILAGDLAKMLGISIKVPADYPVYGSIIFGPKIGHGFYSNMSGRYDALTTDRWFYRTWGRVTGDLIRTTKDGKQVMMEMRVAAGDWAFANDAMNTVVEELNAEGNNITVAGAQAVLWYHEKELYGKHGATNANAKPTDYDTEVRAFIENHGLDAGIAKPARGRAAAEQAVSQRDQGAALPSPGTGGVDAEGIPYFSLPAGPAESARGPGVAGSVAVTGVHYSHTANLPGLSGSRFGLGIKGAERARLDEATDQRIKRRVYFYIAEKGTTAMPRREAGLGVHAYRAELGNLWESGVSPKLNYAVSYISPGVRDEGGTSNNFESSVLDAGFDGYVNRASKVAVVLGKDVLGVTYLGSVAEQQIQLDSAAPGISDSLPSFYSALSREVDKVQAKAAPAAGWSSNIQSMINKGAVKAAEVEWSGVIDWLKAQSGKITKEQLSEYLAQNGVQVEESFLGKGVMSPADARRIDELDNLSNSFLSGAGRALTAEEGAEFNRLLDMEAQLGHEVDGKPIVSPKYNRSPLVIPGGQNYREILLTLPRKMSEPGELWKGFREWGHSKGLSVDTIQEALNDPSDPEYQRFVAEKIGREPNYKSSHWKEYPNVIAHIRVNERMDGSGKRVLFIEEIQSDWAQQGGELGFSRSGVGVRVQPLVDVIERDGEWLVVTRDPGGNEDILATYQNHENAIRFAQDMNLETNDTASIPPAPFVSARKFGVFVKESPYGNDVELKNDKGQVQRFSTMEDAERAANKAGGYASDLGYKEDTPSWSTLAVKRAIAYAVQGGFERVAWTTGQQQKNRYRLSQTIEKVSWHEARYEQKHAKKITIDFISHPREVDSTMLIVNPDGIVIRGGTALGDIEGRHITDVLGKDIGQEIVADGEGEKSGMQLDVGGKGMLEFYDKILVNTVNSVLKKVGGEKVTTVSINGVLHQPGFVITPEMRQSVADGMPLFSLPAETKQQRFERDMQLQSQHLLYEAQSRGYTTIDEMVAKEPLAFAQLSDNWRRNNVLDSLPPDINPDDSFNDWDDEWGTFDPTASDDFNVSYVTEVMEAVSSDLNGMPKRNHLQLQRLGREWLAIGRERKLYGYKFSIQDTLENVAFDMGGRDIKVVKTAPTATDKTFFGSLASSFELRAMGLAKYVPKQKFTLQFKLTAEQQAELQKRDKGDLRKTADADVWVDEVGNVAMNISMFVPGVTNGNLIYQIVGTWAHNAGLRFIGDPNGLSEKALFRRAENMLVNALRTGSTRHLLPHPYQQAAGLEWEAGNDEFNIGALAAFNRDVVALYAPQVAPSITGGESTHENAEMVSSIIPAGRRTGVRATVTDTLLNRAAENKPEVESYADTQRPDFSPVLPDEQILYSLPATMKTVQNTIHDYMSSAGSTNLWDRTVKTQYAKAQKFPETFGRVYNRVQTFMNDTNLFANEAAKHAPDVLRQMDHWLDAFRGLKEDLGPQGRKDRGQASKLLLDGTAADRVWTAAEAAAEGYTPQQFKLYQQMRRAINESLDQLGTSEMIRLTRNMGLDEAREKIKGMPADRARSYLMQEIAKLPNFSEKQQQGLNFVKAEINEKANRIMRLKAQGYAPMMRFGKYAIGFTIDGERAFQMFEREADRNAFEREIEVAGATNITKSIMSQKEFELFRGFDPSALEVFGEMTTLEFYDEQGAVRKATLGETEMFQQFLKRAVATNSAMKRLIHRKKVPGYSVDGSRVLAAFITSNARMASRNINMQEMVTLASQAGGEFGQHGDLKDESIELVKYISQGGEEAQGLRGLMFVNYLGGSVASALVNMSQPIMMSFPYLSQWGAGKAASALRRGFAQAVSRKRPGGLLGEHLIRAEEAGIVSPQEIHHLYAEASRNLGSNPILRRSLLLWGSLFSAAEQFNRRSTFIAAWEIAKGLTPEQLSSMGFKDQYDFAVNSVVETQGTYNRGNRPNWARGAVGGTIFTFKQYSLHYIEWLGRLPRRERVIALAILVLASGLQGLPFADDLDDMIDGVAQSMGYAWSTKDQKRQFVRSIVGKEFGDFLMSGASTLPGVPIDVQGRLSMGNLIPGSALLKPTSSARDALELMGPIGGIVDSWTKGLKAGISGEPLQAALGFSPVAIKNFIKGVDMVHTGAYRDTAGRTVVKTDLVDAFAKIAGFMPPDAAAATRRESVVTELVQVANNYKAKVSAKWAEGMFTNNAEMQAEARRDRDLWNQRNPEMPIKIEMRSVINRVKQMKMDRAARIGATAPKSMRQSVRERLTEG